MLDAPVPRFYVDNSMNNIVEFAEAVRSVPGSVRELAAEAGVSDTLIRLVRDGKRRLTSETGAAVAAALRRWAERCRTAAEAVESAAN